MTCHPRNDVDEACTLVHRERVVFAGDAGINDAVRARVDRIAGDRAKSIFIGRKIGVERCRKHRENAVQRCTHTAFCRGSRAGGEAIASSDG